MGNVNRDRWELVDIPFWHGKKFSDCRISHVDRHIGQSTSTADCRVIWRNTCACALIIICCEKNTSLKIGHPSLYPIRNRAPLSVPSLYIKSGTYFWAPILSVIHFCTPYTIGHPSLCPFRNRAPLSVPYLYKIGHPFLYPLYYIGHPFLYPFLLHDFFIRNVKWWLGLQGLCTLTEIGHPFLCPLYYQAPISVPLPVTQIFYKKRKMVARATNKL